MAKTMTVYVDGKAEEREIVGYDQLPSKGQLGRVSQTPGPRLPRPQLNDGETFVRKLGRVEIVKED